MRKKLFILAFALSLLPLFVGTAAFAATVTAYATVGGGPDEMVFDSSGNMYVKNSTSSTISKITSSGVVTQTWATIPGTTPTPEVMFFDSSGNLYTVNYNTQNVTKITSSGSVSTLFGTFPYKTLAGAMDSSGNIYTATIGGNTIYKVTPSGTETTFSTSISSCSNPLYMIFDSSNNLYVANCDGTISKITPAGVASTFATVGNSTNYPVALIFDSSGNLYSWNYGGTTISKVTPGGSVSTFASGISICNNAHALAFDASGNLYAGNCSGTIYEITPSGTVTSFASDPDPAGLTFDSSGNLYAADKKASIVYKITNVYPAPACTVTLTPNPSPYAYTGTPVTVTWSSTNATMVQDATLGPVSPSGSTQVAAHSADYSCAAWSATGGWSATTTAILTSTPPPPPTVSISASSTNIVTGSSTKITADFAAGSGQTASQTSTTIYLTSGSTWTVPSNWNSFNNSIEVIAAGGGGYTSTAGGGGGGGAYSKVSNVALTPGSTVTFNVGPGGAAATAGTDSYFCNAILNCASISGTAVIAGAKGGGGGAAASVTAFASDANEPFILAFGPSGNLYAADDLTTGGITVISPSGTTLHVWSLGSSGAPAALAFDSSGNLFVSVPYNSYITKITPSGTVTANWATVTNDPGPLAFDSSGNLYAADQYNIANGDPVAKITSGGVVTQTWATVGNGPEGLVIDSSGNLYTAIYTSGTISKITPSGTVTKVWATVGSYPNAIAIDSSGNLYVTNSGSNTISKVTPSGTVTLAWATVGTGPRTLTIDPSGNLYTINTAGNISEISPTGVVTTITTITGSGTVALAVGPDGNLYLVYAGGSTIYKITLPTAQGGLSSSGIGTTKYSGGNGGSSGGGGGAGPLGVGGAGGASGGAAGSGSWTGYAPGAGGNSGIAGSLYGGGGGNNSGAGGQGIIVITYYPITANGTDSLTADNINGDTGNPSGWTGGLGATTNPDSSKTITFTPTSTGTYTFYAMAQTGYFSSWTNYAPLTITVAPGPSCTVSANPSTITTYQGSATLSWNSSNASSFSLQNYSGSVPVVADTPNSDTVTPSQTTTYSGTAIGSGVTTTCSATLTLACTPTYICSGQQVESVNSSCQTTNYGSPCTSPGYCVGGDSYCYYSQADFPPGNGQSSGDLALRPSLVPKGGNIKIYWNVLPDSAKSCTVTGSNNDGTITSTDTASPGIWNTYTGSMISSSIQQQTTYTLSCLQDDGATYKTETQTVNIVPSYQER